MHITEALAITATNSDLGLVVESADCFGGCAGGVCAASPFEESEAERVRPLRATQHHLESIRRATVTRLVQEQLHVFLRHGRAQKGRH